ncbi:MAG TPA: hypothetical protein VHC18_21815 [Amycolatopsis sp.]|nr:hypothetical protein [Amycolatopsis sp.]
MPRPVKTPDPADIPADERAAYEAVVGRQRVHRGLDPDSDEPLELGPYHAALATAPVIGQLISQLGLVFRTRGDHEGTYSHADREFVDQVLAVDNGWNGFMVMHTYDGVSAGVRIEAIEALRAGREEDLTDDERLLATFIRQVLSGGVTDQIWDAMERRISHRGAIEYATFIMFLHLIMRLFQAFGSPDVPAAEIDELVRKIRAGAVPVPDFRERIN